MTYINQINYYDILNIPITASLEDIKKSYRNLCKKYHPDLTKKYECDKLKLIIMAYETLSDEYKRNLYDYELFAHRLTKNENKVYIPEERIKYGKSLSELAQIGLLRKKFKRKDIISHFDYDINILLTPSESYSGVKAKFSLPVRKLCPYCRGSDPRCYFCDGLGRIYSTQKMEVDIPENILHNTIINVDLINSCKIKFVSYTLKNLKIKISILGKQN